MRYFLVYDHKPSSMRCGAKCMCPPFGPEALYFRDEDRLWDYVTFWQDHFQNWMIFDLGDQGPYMPSTVAAATPRDVAAHNPRGCVAG